MRRVDDSLAVLLPMMMVAIGACVGLALRSHLQRMAKLGQKDAVRQLDDDLLSCDTNLLSAHLTAILERLGSIEQRLDAMDGRLRSSVATGASAARDEEGRQRPDRREIEAQRY